MGFVNQSIAQLRDLFASMTPAARITSALLLGVIVVSLGYLFQGYSGGAGEYLFGGEFLQARDADRVEAAIAKAGLTEAEREGGRIRVPRGQKAAYLAAVADAGALPANFDTLLDESLEAGLLVDRETRKQKYKAGREKQLSMIVSQMTGVDDAKVLYDIRESRGWSKERSTATVSLLPEAGATLDASRVKMIRNAVAGAIVGLEPANVTILNLSDGSELAGGQVDAAAFNDPYFETRTRYEQLMKAQIEDLLRLIKPSVTVQVSAELDETLSAEVRTLKSEGEPSLIRESSEEQVSSNKQAEDRGPPGLTVNGPNGAPPDEAVAKNENTSQTSARETQNLVPTTEELLRRTGLAPKHVRAAITVPSEYLVRVWRETNPDAAADEKPDGTTLENLEEVVKTKIRTTVAQLFPKELAEDPYPNVEVTFLQSLTPDPVTPPSMANEALGWFNQHAGSLGMGFLALVSLVMLRSLVRSIPQTETAVALAPPTLATETVRNDATTDTKAAGETASAAGKEGKQRPRLRLKKGPTLKDDLTEMVREDPDGAAAILRTWIGNAS